MTPADLAALVARVGYAGASRATGLARSTIYGVVTGYGRRGRPRRSTQLPTRGAAARPEVRERLSEPISLVVLYARAVQVREDQETGALTADPDPRVLDVVYGDAFDESRDQPFVGMYFSQEPAASYEDVATHLDSYFEMKQQALEQATERPQRPYVTRQGGVVVENLGSPEGAVIVAYLWRFYHKQPGPGGASGRKATHHETPWLKPSPKLRRVQEDIMGAEKVDLAYRTYEDGKPQRGPIA